MFLRYNLFPLCWALIILLLTLMPGSNMPDLSIWDLFSFDKFAHMLVFLVLVFTLIIGLTKQYTFAKIRKHSVAYALAFSVLYGLIIEVVQMMSPGRSFEVLDFVADTAGCLAGRGIFYLVYKI